MAIYDKVVAHLTQADIPHYTRFHLKDATLMALKWFVDGTRTKSDQLVVVIEVERQGQNPENPDATYHQWEELYSRSVQADSRPRGMGLKPRRKRPAKGSRARLSTERDAS